MLIGVGLVDDMKKGIIDCFWLLLMLWFVVLIGCIVSDVVNNLFVVIVMLLMGLVVGWCIW